MELFLILLKMVETPNFVFKWGRKEPKLKLVSFVLFKKLFSKFIIRTIVARIGRDGGGLTRVRVCCAGRVVMVVESRSDRHHRQRLPCDAVDYHRVEYHPPVHSSITETQTEVTAPRFLLSSRRKTIRYNLNCHPITWEENTLGFLKTAEFFSWLLS